MLLLELEFSCLNKQQIDVCRPHSEWNEDVLMLDI